MKLVFLGTRGEIDARSRRHRMHASVLVAYEGRRVMIDAGLDWLGRLSEVAPRAIVLTHAHPDHAWGLRAGAPCPVYGTGAVWRALEAFPIEEHHRLVVTPRRRVEIEGIGFEAFTVEHSIRAPAVGYRVTAGRVTIFYVPDLVEIHERKDALEGAHLYVGDGAMMARSLVRGRGDTRIGHASVRTQLGWCRREGVPEAIFTHCGSQIVKGDQRMLRARLQAWAEELGIVASFAHDGMERVLR